MHWGFVDGWGWVWMVLMMGVLWLGLVAAIWAIFRTGRDSRSGERAPTAPPAPPAPPATQTLAQRFARGEISEDEYRERMEVLREAS